MNTIDKTRWPDGPWQNEDDHIVWVDEATGLDCMIHRGPLGALCGYVAVTEGHPLYRFDYTEIDTNIDVHGSLTYSNSCQGELCHIPEEGRPDNVWWFGFDCAHAWDVVPGLWDMMGPTDDDTHPMLRRTYKHMAYVRGECVRLALQLKTLQEPDFPHWLSQQPDGKWSITDKGIDD